MGLCKCPQRKVSTLFCFKHHVNVCESCLVTEHSQCIVRSYLSWLQDNDYNSNCTLCQRSLIDTNEETIRLNCYDLFHWSCLNQYCLSFPNHTAPDGYTCPTCHTCIFPPLNLVSPVAEQLRRKLSTVNWANRLPMLSNNLTETENNGYVIVNPTNQSNVLSHHPHRTIDMPTILTTRPSQLNMYDDDDNDKYKSRSVFTWFARWLRTQQSLNRRTQHTLSSTRRSFYCILVILFVFLTLLIVLYHFTRQDNNQQDPQFNPLNNPFIRVANRLRQNSN